MIPITFYSHNLLTCRLALVRKAKSHVQIEYPSLGGENAENGKMKMVNGQLVTVPVRVFIDGTRADGKLTHDDGGRSGRSGRSSTPCDQCQMELRQNSVVAELPALLLFIQQFSHLRL